jgi:hypothetical protein
MRVQVHRLTLLEHVGALWIKVGLYDRNSGERLPVLVDGQAKSRRFLTFTWNSV